MVEDLVDGLIESYTNEKAYAEEWNLKAIQESVFELFGLRLDLGPVEDLTQNRIREIILEKAHTAYQHKEEEFEAPLMRELEHYILLQSVDNQWKDHLLSMDHLKEGIGLRGYGQRDPLREYQKEGYEMFMEMVERIKAESISFLFHIRPSREEDLAMQSPREQEMFLSHGEPEKPATVKREGRKIGRNEPCPCGSGKKYKKCCGRNV